MRRASSLLAMCMFVLSLLAIAGGLLLELTVEGGDEDVWFIYAGVGLVLTYGGVGALISSKQPRNPIGWLLLTVGLVFALTAAGDELVGLGVRQPELPGYTVPVAWVQSWVYIVALASVPLLLLLFPTGRSPSPRWRPLGWAIVVLAGVAIVGVIVRPAPLESPGGYVLDNPTAIASPLADRLLTIGGWGSLAAAIGALVALIVRFRRSSGDERQQIRWLAYVGLGMLALMVGTILSEDVVLLNNVLFFALFLFLGIGIPVAVGVAVLKFRLYDIDVVIRKTLIYGVLAAFVSGVYVLGVVLIGGLTTDGLVASIVATTVVAAAFEPVRTHVIRLADRLVFGRRAAPYEVLARFSERVAGAYADEDVIPRAARVIAEGTGAERAEVWVRVGGTLRRGAAWPSSEGNGHRGADRAVRVVHQGEDLGEIRVWTAPGQPLRGTEEALLDDLAAQTASVLRNVALTSELEARVHELSVRADELRASRNRIVRAHDAERRRLERNIHDGAQQHLVALAVKLRLAATMAERDPERAASMLHDLRGETDAALRTLLDLASGIYPAVLEEHGIGPALRSQRAAEGTAVSVHDAGLGRFPIEFEAAVYFVCLEAIQNAAKYARASRIDVRLATESGSLTFEVADDGVGFDASSTPDGSGLQNMRDRIASFGGEVRIDSVPGAGTTVRGSVPVPVGAAA